MSQCIKKLLILYLHQIKDNKIFYTKKNVCPNDFF